MVNIGIYVMLFGIGSLILNIFGMEFKLLMWLGEGYLSRLGIVALGALLIAIGIAINKRKNNVEAE